MGLSLGYGSGGGGSSTEKSKQFWGVPTTFMMDALMYMLTGETMRDLYTTTDKKGREKIYGGTGTPVMKKYLKGDYSDKARSWVDTFFGGEAGGGPAGAWPEAGGIPGSTEEGGLIPWGLNKYFSGLKDIEDTINTPVTTVRFGGAELPVYNQRLARMKSDLNREIGGLVAEPMLGTFWNLIGAPAQGATYGINTQTYSQDPTWGVGLDFGLKSKQK